MEKIYSRIYPEQLLHLINRVGDITEGRRDLCEPTEFIQIATMKHQKGKTFYPHKHKWRQEDGNIVPQEAWLVIKGAVKAILYDIDNTIIATPILAAGDLSCTFFGGHNYEILHDDTIIYEIKSCRYLGVEIDKERI